MTESGFKCIGHGENSLGFPLACVLFRKEEFYNTVALVVDIVPLHFPETDLAQKVRGRDINVRLCL